MPYLRFILILLFICHTTAHANTRFGFGTIIAVDAEGKNDRNQAPNYTVLYEFRNLNKTSVWRTETYRFERSGRGGDAIYFLDGEPSTAEAAIKVGRAICQTANDVVMFVTSRPGPHRLGATGTIDGGLCHIDLGRGLPVEAIFVGRSEGKPETIGAGLHLILDLSGDAIRGCAVAADRRMQAFPDRPIDCSKLTRSDNAIRGQVAFSFPVPSSGIDVKGKGDPGYRLVSGKETVDMVVDLDVTVDAKGAVSGSYKGTANGVETGQDVRGRVVAATPRPEKPRVWVWLDTFPHIRSAYLVLTFDEQGVVQPGGRILFSKGDPRGTVSEGDLRLDGNQLRGSVTGTVPGKSEAPITCAIDAELLGNRWLMGACTITTEGETQTTTLRGGLCSADGPRMVGPDKSEVKKLHAMFGEGAE